MIAQASEMPSKVLVPRPISSRITRLRGGRVVEDVGRLGHLDHERALAAAQLVGRADAGEQAVDHADPRPLRRHEAADLGQHGDQGDLADVRALAGHVRPGDQQDRAVRRRRGAVSLGTNVARRAGAHRAPDAARPRPRRPARRRSRGGSSRAGRPVRRARRGRPPATSTAPAWISRGASAGDPVAERR